MGENSNIAWTDHTFNPWIGCDEVSKACDHCYARELSEKYGWATWGPDQPRHRTSPTNWKQPLAWNRKAARDGIRFKVFCLSLGDFADNKVPAEWRDDLKALIRATPHLDWLCLTKRPQNLIKLYGAEFFERERHHIWLGATAENQIEYERRRDALLAVPARVHFFSCEPLLGRIDLGAGQPHGDWYIVGGESGPKRRGMNMEWVEQLRFQASNRGAAFFFKQDTGHKPGVKGRASDALWACKTFPNVPVPA